MSLESLYPIAIPVTDELALSQLETWISAEYGPGYEFDIAYPDQSTSIWEYSAVDHHDYNDLFNQYVNAGAALTNTMHSELDMQHLSQYSALSAVVSLPPLAAAPTPVPTAPPPVAEAYHSSAALQPSSETPLLPSPSAAPVLPQTQNNFQTGVTSSGTFYVGPSGKIEDTNSGAPVYSTTTAQRIAIADKIALLDMPRHKRAFKRSTSVACFFCRKRKIACGGPPEGTVDRTCGWCARRNQKCAYPPSGAKSLRFRPYQSQGSSGSPTVPSASQIKNESS
ncbi:hypothetical protein WOLCODRAFT_166525 [Wolfiporia cocos MD-104 SS10]|uniref:Zn(2)-C6 fungal-type domain-containing protein n=1 Tax=Wolfiporia cocos (strain MD-104) TaxID=742152 RepID=A0A2H3JDW5_WOLCO|nr:hypothetical protein WOLCODRAFT_166525 [Wolfiporia cocos MD-104 SS10]